MQTEEYFMTTVQFPCRMDEMYDETFEDTDTDA